MRVNKKGLICFSLTALMLGFLLSKMGAVKAQEVASGYWSLTEGPVTEAGLEEYYDVTHKLSYKEDAVAGTVTHYRTTSYTTDADGYVEGNFVTTYSLAPSKINGDETVSFKIVASVDNNMKNFIHSNVANLYLNDSRRFYRKSDDSDYGSDLKIMTGPNHVLQGSETVYYKIPAGNKEGDTMTISAETSQGQMSSGKLVGGMTTKWTYRWVASTPSATDSAQKPDVGFDAGTQKPAIVKKPGKGVVAKIKNVKGAKAKVTVKTIGGTLKYQIRYKVGSVKKWKTVNPSAKNAFTLKVKKGKTVYVQARYINATGKGAWGKTKKLKTDKK